MKKWLVGVVGVGMLSLASTSLAAPMVDDLNGGTDAGANYVDGQFANDAVLPSDLGYGQFSTSEIIGGAASLVNDMPLSPLRQGRMAWLSTASAWAGDYSSIATVSYDLNLSIGNLGGWAFESLIFKARNGDIWVWSGLQYGNDLTYGGTPPVTLSETRTYLLSLSYGNGEYLWSSPNLGIYDGDDPALFLADLKSVQSIGIGIMTMGPVGDPTGYNFDYLTLDNFTLSDAPGPMGVPEPETVWMMLAVVASLGVTFRRQLTALVTRA